MIGKVNSSITVIKLYEYAVQHNMLNAEATIVLDIINREKRVSNVFGVVSNSSSDFISPINNTSTIDFDTLIEYSIEDLITLLST